MKSKFKGGINGFEVELKKGEEKIKLRFNSKGDFLEEEKK